MNRLIATRARLKSHFIRQAFDISYLLVTLLLGAHVLIAMAPYKFTLMVMMMMMKMMTTVSVLLDKCQWI